MDQNESTRPMCKVMSKKYHPIWRAMCTGLEVASVPLVPCFLMKFTYHECEMVT